MEEEKRKSSGLIKWVIIALVVWFLYDNLLAKHWQVIFSDKVNAGWIVDSTSPKFKDQTECANYAASLQTTGSGAFRYSCGYKCKTSSSDVRAECKKQI